MSNSAHLSRLIDFSDLEASDRALREALAGSSGVDRLSVETQLARVFGLDGDYEAAQELLCRVRNDLPEGPSAARVRVDLEQGRCHRDLGRVEEARDCFQVALEQALALQDGYLAMDAAHMLALVGDRQQQIAAGEHALEILESLQDHEVRYWLGPILNNLGWGYFEGGELERALEYFVRATEARGAGPAKPLLIAKFAEAKTRRALGLCEEALKELKALEAENVKLGSPAPFVDEEIAECLLTLQRLDEARIYFAKAYEQLSKFDELRQSEPERLDRLKQMSEQPTGS